MLLTAIGIKPFDLTIEMLVADDPEVRTELDNIIIDMITTSQGDLNPMRQVIHDMQDDPGLLEHLSERRERRRIVHENQRLGRVVENLVEKSLKGQGFKVCRTGVGSDFKIEADDIAQLELSKSGKTWLIEVKATRDDSVRMTSTQARRSVEEGTGFLLCVVPVNPGSSLPDLHDVQTNMRFVANVGPKVAGLCKALDNLENLRDSITIENSSGIQLEVVSGIARVRVANSIWQNSGFPLDELAQRLM